MEAGAGSNNSEAEGQFARLRRLLEEAELPQHFARAAEWAAETGCEECDARRGAATEGLVEHLGLRSFPASRLRKAAKALEEEATAQKVAQPQPMVPALALPAPARHRGPPTCLSAFLAAFTMGFSRHALVVASVQGNAEMATRMRDQFTNIGVLSAFMAAIVGESFLFGTPEGSSGDVYPFFGLVPKGSTIPFNIALALSMASFALLVLSCILSVASLVILAVVVDDAVGKFFHRVRWSLRAPYLCLLFGILCFLAAACVAAPLHFGPRGVLFQGMLLAAIIVSVIVFVRLIYVADGEAVEFRAARGH